MTKSREVKDWSNVLRERFLLMKISIIPGLLDFMFFEGKVPELIKVPQPEATILVPALCAHRLALGWRYKLCSERPSATDQV